MSTGKGRHVARGSTVAAASLAILALTSAAPARAVDVTDCRQTVAADDVGVVTDDVECTYRCDGTPVHACDPDDATTCPGGGTCTLDGIVLENGATLRLAGHTITAIEKHIVPVRCGAAFQPGRCRVVGPGAIHGWGNPAIDGRGMNLTARHLMADTIEAGAIVTQGRLRLRNVRASSEEGDLGGTKAVKAHGVVLDEGGIVSDGDVSVDDVHLGSRGAIVAGGALQGADLDLGPIGSARGHRVVLDRLTAVLAATGFVPQIGVAAERALVLRQSTVTGYPAADLQSGKKPRLVDSSCGKSVQLDGTTTWGVCSDD